MQHLGYLVNISQYPEAYITSLRKSGYDPLRKRPISAPVKLSKSPEPPVGERAGKQSPARLRKTVIDQRPMRPKTAPPTSRPNRPKTAFRRANAPAVVELSDAGSVTGSVGDMRRSSSSSVKSVRFDDADDEDLVDEESEEVIERATEAQATDVNVAGLDAVVSTYIEEVNVDINPLQERQLSSMALDIVQSVLSESSLELELTNTDPLIQNGEVISEQVREMAWDVANAYLNSENKSAEYLEGVEEAERQEISEIQKTPSPRNSAPSSRNSLMSPVPGASPLANLDQSPLTNNVSPVSNRPTSAGSGRVSFEQGSKQGSQNSLQRTSRPGSAKNSRPGSANKAINPSPLQETESMRESDEEGASTTRKSSLKKVPMQEDGEEAELERQVSRKSVNWREQEQLQ
jgi:hypothetical protein